MKKLDSIVDSGFIRKGLWNGQEGHIFYWNDWGVVANMTENRMYLYDGLKCTFSCLYTHKPKFIKAPMYEEKALLATEVPLLGTLSFLILSFGGGNIISYVRAS